MDDFAISSRAIADTDVQHFSTPDLRYQIGTMILPLQLKGIFIRKVHLLQLGLLYQLGQQFFRVPSHAFPLQALVSRAGRTLRPLQHGEFLSEVVT